MTRKNKQKRLQFLRTVLESSMLTQGRGYKQEILPQVSSKRINDRVVGGKYSAPVLKKIERKTLYK